MMVSMAIFSFVMVVALGAYIRMLDVNRRAQALQTTVNSVNYMLESMVREMRTGSNFTVGTDNIVFLARVNSVGQPVYHGYRKNSNYIERAVRTGSVPLSSDYVAITPSIGMSIDRLTFTRKNPADTLALITILVGARSGNAEFRNYVTTFETEVAVSQRLP